MDSYKVVFFLPSDVEGSHLLKKLFQDKFKLPSGTDENLVFDYISHKSDLISVDWKLYVVSDIEKFEEIRPIYFTNVDAFVGVFDLATSFSSTLNKIDKELELHESNRQIVILGYRSVNDKLFNGECVSVQRNREMYFEFSKRTDLEGIIDHLLEDKDGLKKKITQTL